MPGASPEPIAIVGIGCLFPEGGDLSAYWRTILDATDALGDIPDDHSWSLDDHHDPDPSAPDKTYARRGGFLSKVPFDPLAMGIPPASLGSIDSSQLLALIVAREALQDAGIDPDGTDWDRDRVACILGITSIQELAVTAGARLFGPTWRRSMVRCGVDPAVADVVVQDIGTAFPTWTEQTFPGLLGNVVAGRIANRLDLGGANAVVDAACASSLAAIRFAIAELQTGRADLVLSGGVDTSNDRFMYQCFTRTPAFSPTSDARPFDAAADGIVIGEGLAICALERLSDAEARGHRIYAVIRSTGASSDGRHRSIYAPDPAGQVKALRRAYATAGVSPATVELVEAHGTGTRAGDLAEVRALTEVYAESGRAGRWCALGSVKSQIGHTKGAAGAAGLVKVALALHQRVLPPTAKVDTPHPKLGLDTGPLYLSGRPRPWIRAGDHPRRAAVSAFGFGGANYHALLEEHGSADVAAQSPGATALFLVGAASADALQRSVAALDPDPSIHHASRRCLAAWRPDQAHVAGFVADSADALAARVAAVHRRLSGGPALPGDRVWIGAPTGRPEVALLFPGQGSQYVEMGRTLAVRHPAVRSALDHAEETFRAQGWPSLAQIVYPPPAFTAEEADAQEAVLRSTAWAQPALGAISKGMADLLAGFGIPPRRVAGHSYGELVALHVAGALTAEALWIASRARGEAMADADGTMAAVDGPVDAVAAAVAALGDRDVVVANRNHPGQAVISGTTAAVARAVDHLATSGWPARPLRVAAGFHSPRVAHAVAPFARGLADLPIVPPTIATVLQCGTGRPFPGDPEIIRRILADQIAAPVDWPAVIAALEDDGTSVFVVCGPRGILGGLTRRCTSHPVVSLDAAAANEDGDTQLKTALAELGALGVPVDVSPLLAERPPPDPRPEPPAAVWIAGANPRAPHTLEPTMPDRRTSPPRPPLDGWGAVPTSGAPITPPSGWGDEAPAAAAVGSAPAPATTDPAGSPPAVATAIPAGSDLATALEGTRQALAAFQRTQEVTAEVHGKFLDAFATANETFARLFEAQARLVDRVATAPGRATPPIPARSVGPAPDDASTDDTGSPIGPAPGDRAPLDILGRPDASPPPIDVLGLAVAPPDGGEPLSNPAVSTDLPPLLDARAAVEARRATSDADPTARGAEDGRPPSRAEIEAALLDAVAEKTGYPRGSLQLSMHLDGDLGIDSIKRVEILSAVGDAVRVPELGGDRLATLATLTAIVDALTPESAGHGTPPAVATSPIPDATAVVTTPPVPDLPPDATAPPTTAPQRGVVHPIAAPPGHDSVPSGTWEVHGGGERGAALAEILRTRSAPGPSTAGVVLLGFGNDPVDPRTALAIAKESALVPRFVTVTGRGGRFGRDRSVGDPLQGSLAGLAKTLGREWSGCRPLAIDLDPNDVDLQCLADEILTDRGVVEIGLTNVGPMTLATAPSAVATGSIPLSPGDLVVATGGARGITATCLTALAEAMPLNLWILGRTPADPTEPAWAEGVADADLPAAYIAFAGDDLRRAMEETRTRIRSRGVARTLQTLRDTGAQVTYVAGDARDPDHVAAALQQAQQAHGPVRGLIHGAGVIADGWVVDKDLADFDRVWSTKIDPVSGFLAGLDLDALRLVAFFTSTSGRRGNAGQADYAMANEALVQHALDLSRRIPGAVVKALDWGPWRGGMVDPSLEDHLVAQGHGIIAPDRGAAAFVTALSTPEGVEVVIEGPQPPRGRRIHTLDPRRAWLNDHRLGAHAVVPVAMALEWMVSLAAEVAPDMIVREVRDLAVLKGIVVDTDRSEVALDWNTVPSAEGSAMTCEIHPTDPGPGPASPHYRGVLALGSEMPAAPSLPEGEAGDPYPHTIRDAYDRYLFHGPSLQVLQRIDGLDATGATGWIEASTPSALGVPQACWATDPAVIDASLQLLALWVREQHGVAALPTGIARYRQWVAPTGRIRCRIDVSTGHGPRRGTCDITLSDETGTIFAHLGGVSYTGDPSLDAAFHGPSAPPA